MTQHGGPDDPGTSPDLPEEDAQAIGEIRADIEETRLEMGGTLSELGDRLEPSRLVEQAKENVREATIGRVEETAKGVSEMVLETIKRNPIPAAIAGAGLALLWVNRSDKGSNGYSAAYRSNGYRPEQKSGGLDVSRVGDVAAGVGQNVGQAVGQVGESATQVTSEVIERGRQTVGEVGWRLDRFMKASPLAMGAIAIGTGAVIGALVPETPQERQVLGDASQKLGTAVRDTVDQVTQKAEEGMDKAEATLSGTPA
ncbi:MAG: DUF3618 domain-containing protein [Chloroflexi bacterium]|nr:DUF3618 domain-containing protein [Chloroflexota bacterium]